MRIRTLTALAVLAGAIAVGAVGAVVASADTSTAGSSGASVSNQAARWGSWRQVPPRSTNQESGSQGGGNNQGSISGRYWV
jgi:hypothetical protein